MDRHPVVLAAVRSNITRIAGVVFAVLGVVLAVMVILNPGGSANNVLLPSMVMCCCLQYSSLFGTRNAARAAPNRLRHNEKTPP